MEKKISSNFMSIEKRLTVDFCGITISYNSRRSGGADLAPSIDDVDAEALPPHSIDLFHDLILKADQENLISTFEILVSTDWSQFNKKSTKVVKNNLENCLQSLNNFISSIYTDEYNKSFTKSNNRKFRDRPFAQMYGVWEIPSDKSKNLHCHGILVCYGLYPEHDAWFAKKASQYFSSNGKCSIISIPQVRGKYQLSKAENFVNLEKKSKPRRWGDFAKYWVYIHKTVNNSDQKHLNKGLFTPTLTHQRNHIHPESHRWDKFFKSIKKHIEINN